MFHLNGRGFQNLGICHTLMLLCSLLFWCFNFVSSPWLGLRLLRIRGRFSLFRFHRCCLTRSSARFLSTSFCFLFSSSKISLQKVELISFSWGSYFPMGCRFSPLMVGSFTASAFSSFSQYSYFVLRSLHHQKCHSTSWTMVWRDHSPTVNSSPREFVWWIVVEMKLILFITGS